MRILSIVPGSSTSVYSFLRVCCFLIFVILNGGCLHTPPAGVTRGVVEIKNFRMWDDPDLKVSRGILTGIVIGENTVLTAAHTFLYEPEADHPITIDGRKVEYTIIADGWEGLRGERAFGDKVVDWKEIQEDYLLLQTAESFSDFARLVPLEYERIDDLRGLYFVTRHSGSGDVEAILPKRVLFGKDQRYITVALPKRVREGFYLSGSPLIGTYEDGTLVLVGIASASGNVSAIINGKQRMLDDQLYILPAYRIPFDLIAEP